MNISKALLITSIFAIPACGGSSPQEASTPPPEVDPEVCESNKVLKDGICLCPKLLVDKDGYCIDWADSVLVGAEYLEPGFPAAVYLYSGRSFLPYYLKAGNIDKDPELELVYQPGNSFIWAWNTDGSLVDGWPVAASTYKHGKMALLQLDDDVELEVFSGHEGTAQVSNQCELNVFDYNGVNKNGWPITCGLSVQIAPAAADFDGDNYDEVIYFDQLDLNKINKSGVVQKIEIQNLPFGLDKWSGISIADINGNQSKEIILLSREFPDPDSIRMLRSVYVLDSNFDIVDGFPVEFRNGYSHYPVIGDVDGDGNKEIIVAGAGTISQFETDGILSSIKIISFDGLIKNEINFTDWIGDGIFNHISLADIDRSGSPEILIYNKGYIHAFKPSGVELAGWPIEGGSNFAVGDIDGDQDPDIVTFKDYQSESYFDNKKILTVYGNDGVLKSIQVTIDYMGRSDVEIMPVITDFDLDGRNEVIAIGNYWEGVEGSFPQVWAFDFGGIGHGPIEWGQMFGGPKNSGKYIGQ